MQEECLKRILENQEKMLLAISVIITPKAVRPEIARLNNELIDCYHETRKILGKDYICSRVKD